VTAPHFVENGPNISISFSITFRTPDLDRASMVHNVNAYLRRRGWHPQAGRSFAVARRLESKRLPHLAPSARYPGEAPRMNAVALLLTTPKTSALTVRVVTSVQELRELALAWQELLDQSMRPSLMCAPAWLLAWWEIYGRGRELRVGLFHDGDRLVGVAPLCRRRFWHRPGIPMRRLEFLGGDDNEDDGVCSEILRPIIQPGYEDRVVHDFAAALYGGAFGAWDECMLAAMDGQDPLTAALAFGLRRRHVAVATTLTTQAPYLTLPATWENTSAR